jgi:hypothetical protein
MLFPSQKNKKMLGMWLSSRSIPEKILKADQNFCAPRIGQAKTASLKAERAKADV